MQIKIFIIIINSILYIFLSQSAFASDFTLLADPLPPFNMLTDSEEVRGITADTLITILNKTGIEADYKDIEIMPWGRAIKLAEMGPNTAQISVVRTEEREKIFHWIGPIYSITIGFIAPKKSNITINNIEDLYNYTIGTLRKSASETYAMMDARLPAENLISLPLPDQLLEMLKYQRVDMIVYQDIPCAFHMIKQNIEPDNYEIVYQLRKVPMYIALSNDVKMSIVKSMQNELDAMKTPGPDGKSEFDKILDQYLNHSVIKVHEGK